MGRKKRELYPDFGAELRAIEERGINAELVGKIIRKHRLNSRYNKRLYDRYRLLEDSVPICKREPRFEEENAVNNKIVHDFFGEIVRTKSGYLAGKPVTYAYSTTEEATESTGGADAVKKASKVLTDFITRNNMFGVDFSLVKHMAICGYVGRLFYIDKKGQERVQMIPSYECAILSKFSICEPTYAVRYFYETDIDGNKTLVAEFYDEQYIQKFRGSSESDLKPVGNPEPHMFDACPLQGIPNNSEMMGDAECVMTMIDEYDRAVSDNANEHESFAHAYMVFENLNITEEDLKTCKRSGAFRFKTSSQNGGKVYFLTKQINDTFSENHLNRIVSDIYRFSSTPNLSDDSFSNNSSGVSLKFKLHGLETKCAQAQIEMMDAAQHMWQLLCSSWAVKGIKADPLQIVMDFKRNFPLDLESESRVAQALLAAGMPKKVVFSLMSFIDDVDYVLAELQKEQDDIPDLEDDTEE